MSLSRFYPIGTPGQPWQEAEFDEWRRRWPRQRHYADIACAVAELPKCWYSMHYGQLRYPAEQFDLMAVHNQWQPGRPWALVTAGVHGYETSGVWGSLEFLLHHHAPWVETFNFLVVPCVSPWAYERVHRWNWDGIDPNRSFRHPSPSQEAAALMKLVAHVKNQWNADFLVHVDLHETTLTDESEFRPALAARDGLPFVPGGIPDGFYLVDDTLNPQPEFQRAIIDAVRSVTHIAEPDSQGLLIGSPMVDVGVIRYPLRALGLCASVADARYTTTTEVFPDSPRTNPLVCNEAQAQAVNAALAYVAAL